MLQIVNQTAIQASMKLKNAALVFFFALTALPANASHYYIRGISKCTQFIDHAQGITWDYNCYFKNVIESDSCRNAYLTLASTEKFCCYEPDLWQNVEMVECIEIPNTPVACIF